MEQAQVTLTMTIVIINQQISNSTTIDVKIKANLNKFEKH